MGVILPLLDVSTENCTPGENPEACECQKEHWEPVWNEMFVCAQSGMLLSLTGEYSRDLDRTWRDSKVPECHSLIILWSGKVTKTSPGSLTSLCQDRDKRFPAMPFFTNHVTLCNLMCPSLPPASQLYS